MADDPEPVAAEPAHATGDDMTGLTSRLRVVIEAYGERRERLERLERDLELRNGADD